MVLRSSNANILTTNAIRVQDRNILRQEISLAESAIRNAANQQQFRTVYNSRNIGNPPGNPVRATLTVLQQEFYQAFITAGYQVGLDAASGFWSFRWAARSAEGLVRVYSIRTIVLPGAIHTQTVNAINSFFVGLVPTVTSRVVLISGGTGVINETDFGATERVFYEYVAVVQQADLVDHRNALRASLVASGLGYNASPSNVFVYKTA